VLLVALIASALRVFEVAVGEEGRSLNCPVVVDLQSDEGALPELLARESAFTNMALYGIVAGVDLVPFFSGFR
jgi:hypothetical protein